METPLRLKDGAVEHAGAPLLQRVGPGIALEPDPAGVGALLVARAAGSSSLLGFSLGALEGLERFTACYRHKPYWMRPRVGTRLAEVPAETQSFIGRLADGRWLLLVPLLEDPFRFSLRGRADDTLELVGETGDTRSAGHGGLAAFLAMGDDPFALAAAGARAVVARLGTGRLRADRPVPGFMDRLGWCTWDAFHREVSHDKVREGLESLAARGVRPGFVILDDGWQQVARGPGGEERLVSFAANARFPGGLAETVGLAKERFGVRELLVWHAVVGAWGGVDGASLPGYGVVDQERRLGEGLRAQAADGEKWGPRVGLVPPAHVARFYDDFHGYLRGQGVDGVKVDSQAVLEALAEGQGGRVALARAYHRALEGSALRHFGGRIIHCMAHAQESWYGSRGPGVQRSSDDHAPGSPTSHGAHLYTNAQVGVWFGELAHLDWDMFQSGHAWGAYHAAARALSGGPVVVSDPPGQHDPDLLSRLVCTDGTILRADGPARPTLDCLCRDPTREDVLLKVWNRCGPAGVVGAFHARLPEGPEAAIAGEVSLADVPGLAGDSFVCCRYGAVGVERLSPGADRRGVTLARGQWAIFTFAPIEDGLAVVGLADKLLGAAAVRALSRGARQAVLELRDGGVLLAWCARPPRRCLAAGRPVPFAHDAASGTLRLTLSAPGRQRIEIEW